MKKISLLFFIFYIFILPTWAFTEFEKINKLLNLIEASKIVFIRNGNEYSGKEAKEHLEMKLRYAGNRIKTAEQFIVYLASKSSFSGKAYYVKFENGKKIKSEIWLRNHLKKIENKKIKHKKKSIKH